MDDHLVREASMNSLRSASSSRESIVSDTSSYLAGETTSRLPSSTSKWNTECLESLGIHYHNEFHSSPHDILDLIYEKTNCFCPIHKDKINYVEKLQKKFTFSYAIEDLCRILEDRAPPTKKSKQEKGSTVHGWNFVEDLTDLLAVLNEDMSHLCKEKENESELTGSNEEDFLLGIRDAITLEVAYDLNEKNRIDQGSAPKELYSDIFKALTKLCKIAYHPGSVWRAKTDIQNKVVTSEADLLLYPWENSRQRYMSDSVAIVSIVERKDSQYGGGTAEDKTLEKKPEINDFLDSMVLGQHGGALLCNYSFYTPQLDIPRMKYMPGLIVAGTQVFFTLLEIKGSLLRTLMSNRTQDTTSDRATIYYSKPKNFLKKEDRDTLIAAICRLNNT